MEIINGIHTYACVFLCWEVCMWMRPRLRECVCIHVNTCLDAGM